LRTVCGPRVCERPVQGVDYARHERFRPSPGGERSDLRPRRTTSGLARPRTQSPYVNRERGVGSAKAVSRDHRHTRRPAHTRSRYPERRLRCLASRVGRGLDDGQVPR